MDAVSIRSQKFVETQLTARKVDDISLLPKEIRREIKREAKRIATSDVFGHDFKADKAGNPIEQGLGADGNMTAQSIEAYIKNQTERRKGGPEAGYEENLKKMRAKLAESDARRRATQAAEDDDDD